MTNITSWAAVGKVTQQTGPAEIVRKNQQIPAKINSPIEMQDTVTTAKSKAELTFEDKTTVKITEQSKLVVDDFVYNPTQDVGKLSIKVALGTARYASGQIAKHNPQAVSIQTPTATIAVRGTDFSMTVDELGRSLVILLPSCDEENKSCITGAILVSTDAGEVYMDVAYQATLVESRTMPPTKPVVVTIDQANISNMLIISKPQELKDETVRVQQTTIDRNYLDEDLLKFTALEQNELNDKKEIDINYLDVELLGEIVFDTLTAENKDLLGNLLEKNLLPNYIEGSGLKYFFNEDKSKVTLHRNNTHNAYITFDVEENANLNLKQDGIVINQQVNKGGNSVINIIQQ